ncbi:hypothetical protein J437_LFUL013946 [Ladona fulva]|uniref:Uncharacterized protein n=1 Tax=Ladona fulva TaxID=123851 RepID=A0A8K0KHD8_LADFU|nr:hypothetical protein J437_LFUL013946 [Ladona fulva]
MAEEQRGQRGGQPKGRRSASICAPGLSSMEEAMMASASSASALPPPPAIETTNATPRSARRRPATRSQSARATASGGKPRVKRREGAGGGGGSRAGSEPRLDATTSISASSSPRLQRRATARPHIPVVVTDGDGYDDPPLTATAAARRRRSLRVTPTSGGVPSSPSTQWKRGTSMKGTKSKGSFLDVPGDDSRSPLSDEDDESYRLRSFSLTSKGRKMFKRQLSGEPAIIFYQ